MNTNTEQTLTKEEDKNGVPNVSKSSKFNLLLMWRMNQFSIAVFIIAIIIKVIFMMLR